jgi:hypothetical protein
VDSFLHSAVVIQWTEDAVVMNMMMMAMRSENLSTHGSCMTAHLVSLELLVPDGAPHNLSEELLAWMHPPRQMLSV